MRSRKEFFHAKCPSSPGLDIASGFTPAREVGGDFYDVYVKRDVQPNQLVIAIADASGKGITACFYSLCVRSMLRSYDSTYADLPKIIRSTNNLFCLDTGDTGMFVTAWVGIYDPATKIIRFSSCGHHPAIIKRKDGSLIEVTTSGIALGVAPFDKVKADQFQLETGDWVILYTDGILDARDAEGTHFGKERFFRSHQSCPRSKCPCAHRPYHLDDPRLLQRADPRRRRYPPRPPHPLIVTGNCKSPFGPQFALLPALFVVEIFFAKVYCVCLAGNSMSNIA